MAGSLVCAVVLLCSIAAGGRGADESPAGFQRFEYSQIAMGVAARVVVYSPDESSARRACSAAFDRIARLEDIMSDYRASSELMRLRALAPGQRGVVSPELLFVLCRAQDMAQKSDGAFDVTAGPLVKLWRESRRTAVLPSRSNLNSARSLVGWKKLEVDRAKGTVSFGAAGMQLDLGGIAKGYACDEAMLTLRKHGIRSALVEMGGDIVVSAAPPDRKGWTIEVPGVDPPNSRQLLTNSAVSTSGDASQYVEIGGVRYSHIVDPRTGLGLTDRLLVTVIAPTGITADSLSTAISVLREDKGRVLAREFYGAKVFVRRQK